MKETSTLADIVCIKMCVLPHAAQLHVLTLGADVNNSRLLYLCAYEQFPFVERRAKQPADSLCAALRRSLDLRVSFPSPYDPLPDAGYWLSLWDRLESETKKRYRNQISIGIITVL